MEVVKISPSGYCYGVVDAMVIARNASLDESLPRPIYILGMIVHNQHVTDSFEKIGIHTVDGENRKEILEKIDQGTVIFTAHGVSPEVVQLAKEKGLTTIDASCPDVQITHELIREYANEGYHIIYIGKKGHPEPEGAIGVAPGKVHLISSVEEAKNLDLNQEKIFVTNQTTMSQWDVADMMKIIKERYPQVLLHKEICHATQVRQEAVLKQAKDCDLTIVVGDPKSNNTNRLAQVSIEQAGVPAYRISDVSEMDPNWLIGVHRVAITSGASTPTPIVREVVDYLENFDEKNPESYYSHASLDSEQILPRASKRDLTAKRAKMLQKLREKNGLK